MLLVRGTWQSASANADAGRPVSGRRIYHDQSCRQRLIEPGMQVGLTSAPDGASDNRAPVSGLPPITPLDFGGTFVTVRNKHSNALGPGGLGGGSRITIGGAWSPRGDNLQKTGAPPGYTILSGGRWFPAKSRARRRGGRVA